MPGFHDWTLWQQMDVMSSEMLVVVADEAVQRAMDTLQRRPVGVTSITVQTATGRILTVRLVEP